MDIFTQNKNLIRTVILLVALNLILMSFLAWKEFNHRPPRDEPALFQRREEFHDVSGILKEKLDLTETQVSQIQKIRADFFEKEQILAFNIRNKKDSMNVEMYNEITNEKLVEKLAKEISEMDLEMTHLRIEQAKSLKTICTPKQQRKMQEIVIEIRDYFRPDNQPKKKF
jgi:Spy/CpxP family protein refolding chaperone